MVNCLLWLINFIILSRLFTLTYVVYAQNSTEILPSKERTDIYLPPPTSAYEVENLITMLNQDVANSILILEPNNYTQAEHVTTILNGMNNTIDLIDRKFSNYIWQISNEGH